MLVNPARGEITDEPALLEALETGAIAGAAVDTLAGEQPDGGHLAGNALLEYARRHENLIVLPHLGGATLRRPNGRSSTSARSSRPGWRRRGEHSALDRVFVICEAGVTNYGDPELALRQVEAAAESGADAVKFQAWRTEELVSRPVAERLRAELGYDWFERMQERELPFDELRRLQGHAAERGLVFFATPHDEASLDFLVDELDVPCLKVGSGEASNWSFLRRIGASRKPVLIAFGLQSDDEARKAIDVLGESGAPELVAFHTTSVYPTPPELADLGRIGRLRELLGVPVGLSDHTVGWHIPLAAVALGAMAIEKHLTFDKADPRSLDNPGALEPDELARMTSQIRELEAALSERPADDARLARSRGWALQAVVAARALERGHELSADDVAFKRPGLGGVPAAEAERLLGRRLRRDLQADEQILLDDVE